MLHTHTHTLGDQQQLAFTEVYPCQRKKKKRKKEEEKKEEKIEKRERDLANQTHSFFNPMFYIL